MGKFPESLISSNHHGNKFLCIIQVTAISTAELAKSTLSLLMFVLHRASQYNMYVIYQKKHFLKGGIYRDIPYAPGRHLCFVKKNWEHI